MKYDLHIHKVQRSPKMQRTGWITTNHKDSKRHRSIPQTGQRRKTHPSRFLLKQGNRTILIPKRRRHGKLLGHHISAERGTIRHRTIPNNKLEQNTSKLVIGPRRTCPMDYAPFFFINKTFRINTQPKKSVRPALFNHPTSD